MDILSLLNDDNSRRYECKQGKKWYRMRITILTTSFPLVPGSVSGIFIRRLVTHLPADIQTTVITPCTTVPLGNIGEEHFTLKCFRYAPSALQHLAHEPGGIPVALRNNKLFYFLLPSFIVAMFLACLRSARQSDLIHANWSSNGLIAGLAGCLMRTPVLTTVRGEDVSRLSSSRFNAALMYLCLLMSRRVVTVSEAIYHSIVRRFPNRAHKVCLIPNGVDETFLAVRPGRKSGKVHLLTVGSLIPRKGIDQILYAMSRLGESANLVLSIVGEGPERSRLESIVTSLALEPRVQLLGRMAPERMGEVLARADIFVLASHSEGRPNVILEAMASGLPVVASRIEGVDELVNEGTTGLLFEPGEVEDLSAKITVLARNARLRQQMGEAARQFIVQQQLLWRQTAERYAELYRQLVAE